MGTNTRGQLGECLANESQSSREPCRLSLFGVPSPLQVVSVVAGGSHVLALTATHLV